MLSALKQAMRPISGKAPIMAFAATTVTSGTFPRHPNLRPTITFQGDYETLYDQAGMMVRIDDTHWIKLGIEHSDNITNFSIVVTRGQSDWSVFGQPLLSGPQSVRLDPSGRRG